MRADREVCVRAGVGASVCARTEERLLGDVHLNLRLRVPRLGRGVEDDRPDREVEEEAGEHEGGRAQPREAGRDDVAEQEEGHEEVVVQRRLDGVDQRRREHVGPRLGPHPAREGDLGPPLDEHDRHEQRHDAALHGLGGQRALRHAAAHKEEDVQLRRRAVPMERVHAGGRRQAAAERLEVLLLPLRAVALAGDQVLRVPAHDEQQRVQLGRVEPRQPRGRVRQARRVARRGCGRLLLAGRCLTVDGAAVPADAGAAALAVEHDESRDGHQR